MRSRELLAAAAFLGVALQAITPADAAWGREHGGSPDRDQGGWRGGGGWREGGGGHGGGGEFRRGGSWGGGWRGGFGSRSGWNGYGSGYQPGWGGWGGGYSPVFYGGYDSAPYGYGPVAVAAPVYGRGYRLRLAAGVRSRPPLCSPQLRLQLWSVIGGE